MEGGWLEGDVSPTVDTICQRALEHAATHTLRAINSSDGSSFSCHRGLRTGSYEYASLNTASDDDEPVMELAFENVNGAVARQQSKGTISEIVTF